MFRGIIGFLGILLVIAADIYDSLYILSNIESFSFIDPFILVFNGIHILLSVCLIISLAMVVFIDGLDSSGISNFNKASKNFNTCYYIWAIMLTAIFLMESINCFIKDDVANGTFLLFLGIALYIFIERTSKEGKRNVQEALLKKSRKIRGKSI